MREWYAASELAGLPGLPGTVQRIGAIAKLRGWQSRRRAARGGGYEYHLSSLPDAAQTRLKADSDMARITEIVAAIPAPEAPQIPAEQKPDPAEDERARQRRRVEGLAKFSALAPTHTKRLRAKGREWLVLACGQIVREEGMTREAARMALVERVNLGKVPVPAVAADALPLRHGRRALTEPTLHAWTLAYERDGIWGLTDGYGNRKGGSKIDTQPALQRLILGQMFAQPQSTGEDLYALMQARAEELQADGVALPAKRTVQLFRSRWIAENAQLWSRMVNPGQWKNHFQVAFGSHHDQIYRLNQLWELDSTPGDWLLTDGRHTVVGCIDLYSRRLALHVSKSSTAKAVGQCFRRAALAWGLPEAVRTDNGADYVSDYFSGVLRDLEIPQHLCMPFASEQKGTVERALKTMAYGALKLLPGYAGHNVAEAQAIRSRKTFAERVMTPGEIIEVDLSAADLQRTLDQWLDAIYHQDPHAGDGMRGLTPFAKAAAWTGEIRAVDPRALDALLLPLGGTREVSKKGIRWEGRLYISPALARWIGDPVYCRYDEADLGRLYVYTDERFICVAQCPEMTGISRAEVAAVAHAEQRKFMAEQTEELKRHKRATKENAADLVLKHRAKQAGKLVEFPRETTPYTTPMLDAAGEAARASEPAPMRVDTPEQLAVAAALPTIQAPVGSGSNVVQLETSRTRYLKWLKLDEEVIRGEHAGNPEALRWWRAYQECAEFKAEKIMSEDPSLEAYGPTGKARG